MINGLIFLSIFFSVGNARDINDISKIIISSDELVIEGQGFENISSLNIAGADKKIVKEYNLDNITGNKVVARPIGRELLSKDKIFYLNITTLNGESYFPIVLKGQKDSKLFYKIATKAKSNPSKNIMVDEKSEINFSPSTESTGYNYDYSIYANPSGDLAIKNDLKDIFKIDSEGNVEILGNLKVNGNREGQLGPYYTNYEANGNYRISNVIISDDNNISGVVNFTASGNMDIATGTFKVEASSGRVGVGTSTPNYKLDVVGANNSGIRLKQAALSNSNALNFFNGLTMEAPAGTPSYSLGNIIGNLFGINSFDGATYRNIFSLDIIGNGTVSGSLKIGNYTLPSTAGATGTYLQSAGGGVVNWVTIPTGSVPSDGGQANRILTSSGNNNPTWNSTLSDISYIDLNANLATPTWKEGRMFYDRDNDAIAYYNAQNGVVIDLGQEMVFLARNTSGVNIPNGSAVYVTGAQANRPTIAMARADLVSTSRVIGITTQDISNNSLGYVTMTGLVHDLNTNAFNEGDILYLSSTVAGGFTTTAPTAPNVAVICGRVIVRAPNDGVIGVAPVIGSGNVVGPSSSVAGRPATFNDTSGKVITNTVPYTIPTVNGVSGQVLATSGTGTTFWTNAGTGNVSGAASSTVDNLASFSDTTGKSLKDSGLLSSNIPTMSAGAGAANRMILSAGASKQLTNTNYSMPLNDGTSGYSLVTDGLGNVGWSLSQPIILDLQVGKSYTTNQMAIFSSDSLFRAKTNFTYSGDIYQDYYNGNLNWVSPPPLATGVSQGGDVTNLSTNSVDVSAGRGNIVQYLNRLVPTISPVQWSTFTGLALPNVNGWNTIYVDSNGTVKAISGIQDNIFQTDNMVLAVANPVIGNLASMRTTSSNPVTQLRELSNFLGTMKNGFNYSGNADLSFQRSSGLIFSWGSEWGTSSPNTINYSPLGTVTFYYYTSAGVSGGARTTLNPNQFNSIGSTLTAVPGGNPWTYQRIYQDFSGNVGILYGQAIYKSQAEALQGIQNDSANVIVPTILQSGFKWVSTVVLNQGATVSSNFNWQNCGTFGCGDSSGSTGEGGGDVFGPSVSTPGDLATFQSTNGKVLEDSGILATDLVTRSTNFTAANRVALSGGVNKTLSETGYTIPNTVCSNGQIFKSDGTNMTCQTDSGMTTPGSVTNSNLVGWGSNNTTLTDTSIASTNVVTAISNMASGNLPQGNGAKGLTDSNVVAANVVTMATNGTGFYVLQSTLANKTASESNVLVANIATMAANATATNQIIVSGAADKTQKATGATIDTANNLSIPGGLNVTGQATFNVGGNSFSLPTGRGTNGQVLTTNGAGTLSWSNGSGGLNSQAAGYTLASSDCNGTVAFTGAGGVNATMGNLANGCVIHIVQQGAGQVTVVGTGGMNIQNSFGLFKTRTQYSVITITQLTTTLSVVSGDVN